MPLLLLTLLLPSQPTPSEALSALATADARTFDGDTPRWSRLGPPDIAPNETFVEAVAFAPDDPTTIVMGTRPQGVFLSRDDGVTWTQAPHSPKTTGNVGVNQDSLRFAPLPDSKTTRLYVGYETSGLFWTDDLLTSPPKRINKGLTNRNIISIAVHPIDPRIVFVGTDNGLHRTTNGGRSWTRLAGGLPDTRKPSCTCVRFDPLDASILLAVYMDTFTGPANGPDGGDQAGVYRSTDVGTTWTPSNAGRPVGIRTVPGLGIRLQEEAAYVVAYARDRTAYLGGMFDGLHRSNDGGQTWTPCVADSVSGIQPSGSVSAIAVDPKDSRRVFVSQAGGVVLRSDNAGQSWRLFSSGLRVGKEPGRKPIAITFTDNSGRTVPMTGSSRAFNNEIYALRFKPGTRRLFAATSAGLYAVSVDE